MESRATFGGTQVAAGVLRMLVLAVVVALLVGGLGGYIVRALTFSASTTTVTETHRPFVTETHRPFVIDQLPYSNASPSPSLQPIYDRNGNTIPV